MPGYSTAAMAHARSFRRGALAKNDHLGGFPNLARRETLTMKKW
jgi:hypothetical protein